MNPSLTLNVSLGGGAYTHGYQQAAFGQSVAMQPSSTSGLSAIRYEIYDFPPTFTCPSGWSTDPSTGVYYYAPTNPTTAPPGFNLPGSGTAVFGFYMLRLRGNGNVLRLNADGSPNTAYDPTLTDEASCIAIPGPYSGALGVGFGLSNQYDTLRNYIGALMQSLRAYEALLATGTIAQTWTNLVHATTGATLATPNVTLNTSAGACGFVFPASPTDGQLVTVADAPANPNWASLAGTATGNTGQKVEKPTAIGTFTAAAGTATMPPVNGASQDYRWHAASSTWLCV